MRPARSNLIGEGWRTLEGPRLACTAIREAFIRDLDVSQASKSAVDHAVWGMAWLGRRRRSCQAAKSAG